MLKDWSFSHDDVEGKDTTHGDFDNGKYPSTWSFTSDVAMMMFVMATLLDEILFERIK